MSVSARETAGSPRDLLPGGRPRGGVPVRLPFAKRWCPKVDGIDFGTLSYPLQLVAEHRVFEGDNVRLLRSDSRDTSGGVVGDCRPRPRARPTKCRAATTTHVRRWISSGKNTENPGFYTGKNRAKMSKICTNLRAPRSSFARARQIRTFPIDSVAPSSLPAARTSRARWRTTSAHTSGAWSPGTCVGRTA